MTQEHLITPSPELVQQWLGNYFGCVVNGELSDSEKYLATQAARWGADQELNACCEWLEDFNCSKRFTAELRAARRPKPPSLKEQALDSWDRLRNEAWCEEIDFDLDFIRRALEALPD